jgi:hypothetical protein
MIWGIFITISFLEKGFRVSNRQSAVSTSCGLESESTYDVPLNLYSALCQIMRGARCFGWNVATTATGRWPIESRCDFRSFLRLIRRDRCLKRGALRISAAALHAGRQDRRRAQTLLAAPHIIRRIPVFAIARRCDLAFMGLEHMTRGVESG